MHLVNASLQVICNPARGTVNIEGESEGIHANSEFLVPSDFGIVNWTGNTDPDYPWRNMDGTIKALDINYLRSINCVLRNTQMIRLHQLSDYCKSYESGFVDLLNVHNVHLHCPDLCHSKKYRC